MLTAFDKVVCELRVMFKSGDCFWLAIAGGCASAHQLH